MFEAFKRTIVRTIGFPSHFPLPGYLLLAPYHRSIHQHFKNILQRRFMNLYCICAQICQTQLPRTCVSRLSPPE